MGLDLKDVLGNSSADRGARRNTARIVAAAGGVGLVVILILLVAAMGGGEVAADSGATTTGADAASALRAGPAPARPEIPAEVAKLLAPYPGRQLLEGTEMAGRGEFEAAEDWLARFLDMPDSRSDQALLALALVERQTGKALAAEDTLRRLLRERKDSPRAGDGAYVLGLMLAEAGPPDEARRGLPRETPVAPEHL